MRQHWVKRCRDVIPSSLWLADQCSLLTGQSGRLCLICIFMNSLFSSVSPAGVGDRRRVPGQQTLGQREGKSWPGGGGPQTQGEEIWLGYKTTLDTSPCPLPLDVYTSQLQNCPITLVTLYSDPECTGDSTRTSLKRCTR